VYVDVNLRSPSFTDVDHRFKYSGQICFLSSSSPFSQSYSNLDSPQTLNFPELFWQMAMLFAQTDYFWETAVGQVSSNSAKNCLLNITEKW